MNRLQARQVMLLGKKVGNKNFPEIPKVEYFFDGKVFMIEVNGKEPAVASMDYANGYFIIKEPPKFKKVTMYRSIYKNGNMNTMQTLQLFPTVDEALKASSSIGYEEVEVMVKDE